MSAIHYKESAIGKNLLSGVTSECQSLSRIIYTTFLPKATVYLCAISMPCCITAEFYWHRFVHISPLFLFFQLPSLLFSYFRHRIVLENFSRFSESLRWIFLTNIWVTDHSSLEACRFFILFLLFSDNKKVSCTCYHTQLSQAPTPTGLVWRAEGPL